MSHLDVHPDMAVLDAGCGPGRLTLPLAEAVGPSGNLIALDIQAGMLERTRQKAESKGLTHIRYIQAGLGEGKLPSRYFDRAVLVTVLGEIPDQEAAMREIFDAMKPGGILSVTEIIFDPHFQRRRRILSLGAAAGFQKSAFYGNAIAYTLHLYKPNTP